MRECAVRHIMHQQRQRNTDYHVLCCASGTLLYCLHSVSCTHDALCTVA